MNLTLIHPQLLLETLHLKRFPKYKFTWEDSLQQKKKKKSGTLPFSGQVELDGPKNDSRNSEDSKVGIKSKDCELWKRQDTHSEKSSRGKTEKSPGFSSVVLGDLFESLSDGKAQELPTVSITMWRSPTVKRRKLWLCAALGQREGLLVCLLHV